MDEKNFEGKLDNCLFFSFCKLQREINRVAEEKFKKTGLAPSLAFLVSIVNHQEGIHQKLIGELLHMSPSTITRFIEKLKKEDLLFTKAEGKNVYVYSTDKGKDLQRDINNAWEDLYEAYSEAFTGEEKEEFHKLICKMLSHFDKSEVNERE